MITPTEIKQNEQIRTYIEKADEALAALGYTCLLYTSDAADEL